jgi:hypothetical protein
MKVPHVTMVVAVLAILQSPLASGGADTDLDVFMREVLAQRDTNWKKLQQYILDEREQIELRGPSHQPIWGERREYSWYIRDGYFIRSPVKVNGATIGESDRRKYEAEFLRRAQQRDRRVTGQASAGTPSTAGSTEAPADGADQAGLDGLLKQVREPQFISSAYFLRFKFEQGTYAFVGRETLAGRDVMRVEYYPTNLYSDRQRRRMARDHDPASPRDAEVQRMMNKVALVTLWIEPASHQIVKYTFDNIDFDFLPGRWLVRLETVRATMTMDQPFAEVWLPRDLEFVVAADIAAGRYDVRYSLEYRDYRQPDVKSKVHIAPEG